LFRAFACKKDAMRWHPRVLKLTLMLALAAACASTPAAPFVRTPDDQIATPPRAIVEPQPTRPEGLGAGQIAAQVIMRVQVDRTGAVRDVQVTTSAGEPYDHDAIEAMKRARFHAAMDKNGQPVDCEILWRLDYSGR
jgi:TonB family protein